MQPDLATLIDSVPDRRAVYDADLAAAREADRVREELEMEPFEQSAEERALDGVSHHVFNTLRGAKEVIEVFDNSGESSTVIATHTFDDVRAIVAESL